MLCKPYRGLPPLMKRKHVISCITSFLREMPHYVLPRISPMGNALACNSGCSSLRAVLSCCWMNPSTISTFPHGPDLRKHWLISKGPFWRLSMIATSSSVSPRMCGTSKMERLRSGRTSKTMKTISPTPYPEVNEVLHLLLINVKEILKDQFVGMYLYG